MGIVGERKEWLRLLNLPDDASRLVAKRIQMEESCGSCPKCESNNVFALIAINHIMCLSCSHQYLWVEGN